MWTAKKWILIMDFQVSRQVVGDIILHRRVYLVPLEFHHHVDKPGLDLSLGLFPTNKITSADGIMAPQGCLYPNSWGICEYVSFRGKGELRMNTGLRLLMRWLWDREIILDYLDEPNIITSILLRGRVKQKVRIRETLFWRCCTAGFEDGRGG